MYTFSPRGNETEPVIQTFQNSNGPFSAKLTADMAVTIRSTLALEKAQTSVDCCSFSRLDTNNSTNDVTTANW